MPEEKLVSHEEVHQKRWRRRGYRRAYKLLKPHYDIAKELINLRHRKKMTQQDVANKLNSHQSRISRIESAEYDARLSTLIALANALDADLEIRLVPRPSREFYSELTTYCARSHEKQAWPASGSLGASIKCKPIRVDQRV